jgi:hypothetical protein
VVKAIENPGLKLLVQGLTVERFQRIGVDELLFVMQMGTVPHELVRESVKTFGEKVIPHFR